jgi:DNA-binding transcriptional ArsR family regulator
LTGKGLAIRIGAMARRKNEACGVDEVDARLLELQAEICQTLANPKRLRIINLLKNGELPVGDMVRAMAIAKANLSQHLAVMRQKGILIARREGTAIYYRLASPKITEACTTMREVLMNLLEDRERLSKTIRGARTNSKK